MKIIASLYTFSVQKLFVDHHVQIKVRALHQTTVPVLPDGEDLAVNQVYDISATIQLCTSTTAIQVFMLAHSCLQSSLSEWRGMCQWGVSLH